MAVIWLCVVEKSERMEHGYTEDRSLRHEEQIHMFLLRPLVSAVAVPTTEWSAELSLLESSKQTTLHFYLMDKSFPLKLGKLLQLEAQLQWHQHRPKRLVCLHLLGPM